MVQTLSVAGDSRVLKWLVGACADATPWLTLSGDQLNIDWDMALAHRRQMTDVESPSTWLTSALTSLMPALPLSLFCELHNSPWRRSERELLTTRVTMDTMAISAEARAALDIVATAADKLVMVAEEALTPKSRSRWSRKALEDSSSALRSLGNVAEVKFFRRDLSIRYQLSRRLAVAKGDMTTFLTGSSASYDYYHRNSDAYRRAESWRLARRLIRVQADLSEQLETMAQSGGVPEQADLASNAAVSESWRRLGHLEQALARTLISAPRQSSGRPVVGFVELGQEFTSLHCSDEPPAPSDASSLGFSSSQSPISSPFGVILKRLDQMSTILGAMRTALYQSKYEAALQSGEVAIRAATDVVNSENHRITREMPVNLKARDLDDALDWLIAESPLLTLLVAGFLAFYSENANENSYGICLSPWLVATVTAKKILGTQPMTYLGMDSADDNGESETAAVEAEERAKDIINGRYLWDISQASLS